jgi:TRAP-type C4-dicarboxylate transport system substrate-binding protein
MPFRPLTTARGWLAFWLALLCCALPGAGGQVAQAGEKKLVLKFATLVPPSGNSKRQARKAVRRLEERTEGRVTARVYWSGSAGDEKTVLRKMRVGQVDASYMGLEIIRLFVPQAMVLGAPNTFTTYKQIDAVREELTPGFNRTAYEKGFKILGWGDVGTLRIFSVKPIRRLQDFRAQRPWIYEESPLLKEFYRIVGCKGVPVGLIDVYQALQTGLIEVVWGSALAATLLRWHSHTKYVSRPIGLLQGAVVLRRGFWDALDERDRQAMLMMARESQDELRDFVRDMDEDIYARLLKRGLVPVPFEDTPAWLQAGKKLRDKMVGRLYSRELLDRMEEIVRCFPDAPETPDGFR